ncbi:sulfatase-like hydrolase/transferase [Lacipirellula sp.]|uniref:sulfatase-like hydrolase/transferase n=1 Tax=Lacipirellula sp. TaxID=2691419 RepID=UPI003D0F98F3
MCGRTLWHLPIGPDENKHCPPEIADHTLAAVFHRAGYDTMYTCKQGNTYPAANKRFDVRREANKRGSTHDSGSGWHGDQLLDYLDSRAETNDQDPFLIFFGFSHPHDARNGKPKLLAKYGAVNHQDKKSLPPANNQQPALPASYLPRHPFDTTHSDVRDEVDVSGVWNNRDERTIRNEIGREFACSENIDVEIGRVLDKLQAMGQLENTVVIYTSDHGIAIGRHGLMGKQNLYEHTWRVPFIAKGPGIAQGARAKGNVYLLDILATLCDLAGVATPATNEGLSMKLVLEGKQDTVRDVQYGCYCGGAKPGIRCVRKGDWKLIKYDGGDESNRETQLFNLAENPEELLEEHQLAEIERSAGSMPLPQQKNLCSDPRYSNKLSELEALLLSEMRRLDDPYRLWSQPQ